MFFQTVEVTPDFLISLSKACFQTVFWRLFKNRPLIGNKKSFWGPPFDRKRRRLLKLFRKSFTKKLYDFRMLLILIFQTVSWTKMFPVKLFLGMLHKLSPCLKQRCPGIYIGFGMLVGLHFQTISQALRGGGAGWMTPRA
ncbi:hypothetical protein FYB92_05115 [Novacetimonas sp. GS1]